MERIRGEEIRRIVNRSSTGEAHSESNGQRGAKEQRTLWSALVGVFFFLLSASFFL